MRFEFGYSEEEKLGKPYDVRLLRRLLPYILPYKKLIGSAILLITLLTLVDLALPYVTKVAIDDYIVPSLRSGKDTSVPPEGNSVKNGTRRSLAFNRHDAAVNRVVARYPDLFTMTDDKAAIAYDDLGMLDREDVRTLRRPHLRGVARMGGLFLLLVCAHFGLSYFQILVLEYTGQMMMHDLRLRVFNHLQILSVAFFNRNPVGRLVTRVTNDVQNMNELFTSVIVFVFKDLFLLVGIAVTLLILNWRLALISFAVLPLVAYASIRFAHHAREIFRQLRVKLADINSRFAETVGGIKVIQLFAHERANFERFRRLNHENYLAGMQQIKVFAIFMPVIEVLGAVAIAVVIYFGGHGVVQETVSLGALVAFISYMRMFFRPIRDIAEKYNIMQNAMASAERLFLIIDSTEMDAGRDGSPAEAETRTPPLPIERVESLSLDRISFAYVPGQPVLQSVSFTITAGRTVAVVGPTGSGKTSLINLVIRFYDPDSGRILINGHDTRQMDVTALRRRMALVTQDPFLFADTIGRNIFQGLNDADDHHVQQVLEASHLSSWIAQLPQGIDTVLSEGGLSVSSGQRQLISIARALARDPDLIILDEATSYIDSETERIVQEALANLMQGRTTLIIAHRLSTIRQADIILVLNRGRIIESGTHRSLLAQEGFYHHLYQLQQ